MSLQIHDHQADADKIVHMADLLRGILGVDVRLPQRLGSGVEDTPRREGASLFLHLSAGRGALDRLRQADDEMVWRTLAEFYLGPQLAGTWATDALRHRWRLRHSQRRGGAPAQSVVSRRLDRWLRQHPEVPRGMGIAVDQRTVPSAELFQRAASFVGRLHRLRAKASFGTLCSACWSALYSDTRDIAFLQLLLMRVAGDAGEVGYSAEIFTDRMFRPLRVTNGLSFDSGQTPPAPSSVSPLSPLANVGAPGVSETGVPSSDAQGNAPDIDSIDSSRARLRAGFVFREAATGRLRLELYSDYRFADGLRLRAELRHSRMRADLAMGVSMLVLPAGVAVTESPFMIAKYRYDIDLPWEPSSPKKAYALYLRVINGGGLPLTEEAALRFRTPSRARAAH